MATVIHLNVGGESNPLLVAAVKFWLTVFNNCPFWSCVPLWNMLCPLFLVITGSEATCPSSIGSSAMEDLQLVVKDYEIDSKSLSLELKTVLPLNSIRTNFKKYLLDNPSLPSLANVSYKSSR